MYLTKLGTDSKKSNSQKRIGEKLAVGAGVSGVYGSPLCGQEEAVAAARRNQRLLFIEKRRNHLSGFCNSLRYELMSVTFVPTLSGGKFATQADTTSCNMLILTQLCYRY